MKTREFDIENYKIEDIIKEEVRKAAKEHIATFTHPFFISGTESFMRVETYYGKYKSFADMTKAEQATIKKLAKEQYEAKKEATLKRWKELKAKCDDVFEDDKAYKRLLPELTDLYYCQAISALEDFYSKKINSKTASNARFRARAMKYSQISCD